MKQILGVILLIANGMILSIILSCFKDALRDAKKTKHKIFWTIVGFGADAWEFCTLAFLTLMFGLICIF